MKIPLDSSKLLERALADHALISQYTDSIGRMFGGGHAELVRAATETARQFLTKKLVQHFDYEEQQIFPALLQPTVSETVRRLVLEIQDEHESLLEEAQQLDKMLAAHEAGGDHEDSLRQAMLSFLQKLEKHSVKENELFPSML